MRDNNRAGRWCPADSQGGHAVAGIDSSGMDKVLRDAVAAGGVPHVAAIAADRDGVIYQGAAGPRTVGEDAPVAADTMFRITSMTKMPCTVVALQQMEKGTLDLDAPVEHYCPEFAEVQVLTGFDGGTPQFRPPASQATVKQLLTHTAGLGYWFWNGDLLQWHKVTGIPNVVAGLKSSLRAPLVADPGTAFVYGINTDWLGQVIEAVTGKTLDVAVKEGVTGPLGMDHTTFLMTDDERGNCTPVHVKGEDGTWVSIGEILNQQPEYFIGGTRLYRPPSEYIKFERALLRGGELDGTRILQQRRWMRRSVTRSVTWTSRPRPDVRPSGHQTLALGPGLSRLRPAAEHRGSAGHAPGVVRAWAGLSNRTLGRPHHRDLRLDLQRHAAVRHAEASRCTRTSNGAVRRAAIALGWSAVRPGPGPRCLTQVCRRLVGLGGFEDAPLGLSCRPAIRLA